VATPTAARNNRVTKNLCFIKHVVLLLQNTLYIKILFRKK